MSPAMNRYQPSDREAVLLTVRTTHAAPWQGHPAQYVLDDNDGLCISAGSDAIVDVQPAPRSLPTTFGARIAATIPMIGGARRMQLVRRAGSDTACPWLAENGSSYHENHLTGIEVLHDPEAGQPTTEPAAPIPGYIPCDECESSGRNCRDHRSMPQTVDLKLPTGLGAVARVTRGPLDGIAVKGEAEDACWRFHYRDSRGTLVAEWVDGDELTAVEILSAGVEVELP